jgi:serine/threonine protein kinase
MSHRTTWSFTAAFYKEWDSTTGIFIPWNTQYPRPTQDDLFGWQRVTRELGLRDVASFLKDAGPKQDQDLAKKGDGGVPACDQKEADADADLIAILKAADDHAQAVKPALAARQQLSSKQMRIHSPEQAGPRSQGGSGPGQQKLSEDLRDTLVNLGDFFNADEASLVGNGARGHVLVCRGQHFKFAVKVSMQTMPYDEVAGYFKNEAAISHISSVLALERPKREGIVAPFAMLPMQRISGNTTGLMAVQSWNYPDTFYAMLAMEEGVSSLAPEVKAVASLFQDKEGRTKEDAFSRVAQLMGAILFNVNSLHSLNSAHCDVKPDNIIMTKSQGKAAAHPNSRVVAMTADDHSRFIKLGDHGNAKLFSTKFGEDQPKLTQDKRRNRATEACNLALGSGSAQPQLPVCESPAACPAKRMDATESGRGPAVFEVTLRAVHLLTGCAPSTALPDDPPPPAAKIGGWGTRSYSPPEAKPVPVRGKQLSARDWQPGDMWACGVILAEMLSGGSVLGLLHGSPHEKKLFSEAHDEALWCKYLGKNPLAGNSGIPSDWADAIDLMRKLTRENPHLRLTAIEALQHPFLSAGRRLQPKNRDD